MSTTTKVLWTGWVLLGIVLSGNFFFKSFAASVLLPIDEYKIARSAENVAAAWFFTYWMATPGLLAISTIWKLEQP